MAEGPPSGDARTAGGPNIGAIRSGMSRPQDPDAPSLLTTLPAELRLQIYEYLFLRDKPVIVQPRASWFGSTRFLDPAEVCSDVGQEHFDCGDWSEVLSVTRDHEDLFQSSEKPSQTSSGIDSGFGLIGSCRQIYTEAIATLYSKNSFILSLTRSEFLTRRIDITVQWMLTLGSTISHLRRVHIRACELDYDGDVRLCSIDLARLARFMWQNPTKELHISFGPHPNFLKDPSAAVHQCEYSKRMENVFAALVKNDTLDIKRYHISERLVSGIFIDDYVRSGRIHHPPNTNPIHHNRGYHNPIHHVIADSDDESDEPIEFVGHGIYRRFYVSDEGRNISWRENHFRPTFSDLPFHLVDAIVEHAILSKDGASFDLDHKTSSGFQTGVLGINSLCRSLALMRWSSINTVTLRMSTDQRVTSFSDFAGLRHWITEPVSGVLGRGHRKTDGKHQIILEFRLDSPSILSMLRIKILRFIQFTLELNHHIQVVFTLINSAHGEERIESYTTTLAQLRENLLVALTGSWKMPFCDWDMACPDIEINGRGTPLRVYYPEGTSQSGQPSHVNQQENEDCISFYDEGKFSSHCKTPGKMTLREVWRDLKIVEKDRRRMSYAIY